MVFNPLVERYRELNLKKCYKINEIEKKKRKKQDKKCGAQKFHSSCYECQWRSRKRMQTFYAKLEEKIAGKSDNHYSVAAASVRQRIMFSQINSNILCIRGSRTVANNEETMTRSLSKSIKTSRLLSETDL